MKAKLRLVLLLTGAAAFAAGAKVARDGNDAGPRINPSAAIAPINPSQTIPPISPSRTPSGAGAPPRPASPFRLDDQGLSESVAAAITRGGAGTAGDGLPIAVDRLRVSASGGVVLLRGVVESESDRSAAGARAAAIAGSANVVNELTVR